MSEITNQIKSLLSDEALRQALTKDSLQEMLSELDSNEAVIASYKVTIEGLNAAEEAIRKEFGLVREERDAARLDANELRGQLTGLEIREKACITLEIRNEYETRRGDEFKELQFATVRNTTIRKTILGEQMVTERMGFNRSDGIYDPGESSRKEPITSEVTETEE